jgi:hypothetical protein
MSKTFKNLKRAECRRRAREKKAEKNGEMNEFYWSLFDSRCGALMVLLAGIFVEKMLVAVLYDFFEEHCEGLKMLCETVYLQENVFSQDVLEKFSWLNATLAQQATMAREWWQSDMLRCRISPPQKPDWVLKFNNVLSRYKEKFSFEIANHNTGKFFCRVTSHYSRIHVDFGVDLSFDIFCLSENEFEYIKLLESDKRDNYIKISGMVVINRNLDESLILTDETPIFVSQRHPLTNSKLTTVREFVREFTP